MYFNSFIIFEGYRFSQYNVDPHVYTYSADEYARHLEGAARYGLCILPLAHLPIILDPDWSKEETDYLFNLAREYDLRFMVMADRYEYPGKPRSIEVWTSTYLRVVTTNPSPKLNLGN